MYCTVAYLLITKYHFMCEVAQKGSWFEFHSPEADSTVEKADQ